jgi:hypothetical protein
MGFGTTQFGGNRFPLVAGPADGVLRPAVADALLDFLSFMLNWALNDRLAQMDPRNAEAVPALNRFAYDPAELWPQNPTPALYLWWKSSNKSQHSALRDRIEASYGFMYIAQEIKVPGGVEPLDGFGELVDQVIRYAADQGYHPDYSYNGAPLGELINITLGWQGWEVSESQAGRLRPVPGQHGVDQHYYPAVMGTIKCWTVVEQRSPDAPTGGASPGDPGTPGDVLSDITAGVYTNADGDVNDTVLILEGVLPAPDGAEDK